MRDGRPGASNQPSTRSKQVHGPGAQNTGADCPVRATPGKRQKMAARRVPSRKLRRKTLSQRRGATDHQLLDLLGRVEVAQNPQTVPPQRPGLVHHGHGQAVADELLGTGSCAEDSDQHEQDDSNRTNPARIEAGPPSRGGNPIHRRQVPPWRSHHQNSIFVSITGTDKSAPDMARSGRHHRRISRPTGWSKSRCRRIATRTSAMCSPTADSP